MNKLTSFLKTILKETYLACTHNFIVGGQRQTISPGQSQWSMDVYRGVIACAMHVFIKNCVKLFNVSFAMVYTRAFNFVFKQLLFFFLQKRFVNN